MTARSVNSPEAAVVIALIVATGVAGLAGWLSFGPRLYVQLVEIGLAWCL